MQVRIFALIVTLSMPLCALAQQNVAVRDKEREQGQPEEMVITGARVQKLRTQMMEAEIHSYDVFNKFNDDARYVINCSVRAPTGTHFKKVVCDTGFEREATQEHGRDYADNLALGTTLNNVPMEARIAAQQEGFKLKMKQVAEEHPEFLKAVMQYTKKQQEYVEATSALTKKN